MLRSEGRAALTAALASAAVLALQVLLPRLFSVLLWYHLGFLAVSLALLGFAAGGVMVARAARRTGERGGRLPAARLAAGAALAIPLSLMLVVRVPLDPTALLDTLQAPLALLFMGLLLAVPFALLGTLVCALLDGHRERLSRIYGATFLGGAAGAALCLWTMDAFGAPRAAAVIALWPLLAAAVAGPAALPAGARAGTPAGPRAVGGAALGWAALALAGALFSMPQTLLPLESRKHFPRIAPEQVLDERWNAFSRVTFYDNPEHHGLWSLSEYYNGTLPRMIGIVIDAWAITSIVERPPRLDAHPVFLSYPPTLAYVGTHRNFDALVIGAGGGIDVQAALAAGAGHVTAVELNPLIVDGVRGRFAEFCGGLYDDPRVTVVVGEGRDFLERDEHLYDRIVLSGVDTFAASQAGAFALSENFLYTVEAFRTLLARLRPGGVIEMTRWWFEPPRQALRLALTAAAVLREQGVREPGLHLFIARAGFNSIFLLKKEGFVEPEAELLRQACEVRGCLPVYGRETPSHPTFVEALALPDPSGFISSYPYRIDPTTDDRPFFFEYSRLSTLFRAEGDWIRDRLGGQEVLAACLLVLLLLAAPLVWLARDGVGPSAGASARAPAGAPGALRSRERAAFAALGLGYMFVELPLMQRLSLPLGHPVLAVAVVLVALLVWSGCGALLAGRAAGAVSASRAALCAAIGVAAVLVGAQGALAGVLEESTVAVRIAAVVGFLAVPGLLLGAPFPLALTALRDRSAPSVPAAFLWNALASVIAGPLAVMLAMTWGFQLTLLAGAACYLLAALLLRGGTDGVWHHAGFVRGSPG